MLRKTRERTRVLCMRAEKEEGESKDDVGLIE
jgi:hypothetical protein